MRCRFVMLRIFVGAIIGCVSGLGFGAPWQPLPLVGHAFAYNSCQYGVGSEFTGVWDTGYGAGSNAPASAIRGQISVQQPSFICNDGISYWVMVNQPDSQCLQNGTHSVYAQVGWMVDGAGLLDNFYERAEMSFQPNCDPGPFFYGYNAWGGSHTYEVQTGGTIYGDYASFTIDGVQANTLNTDWAHATNYQVAGEIHYSEEYMGGQTVRGLYHCEQFAQNNPCSPSTQTNVGAICPNSGHTQGCLPPTNPNGCYYFNSSTTTSNGFNVYEKRSKTPPSC